jgi:capsular exopolysaccharide synthesis family protein
VELQAFLGLLRRRWPIIVLTFVLGLAGAFVVTKSTPKTYSATARLYVSFPPASNVQEAFQGVQLSQDLLGSYTKVLVSDKTTQIIAKSLNGRLTPPQIKNRISGSVVVNTVLIEVKASEGVAGHAQQLANASAVALTEVIADLQTTKTGGITAQLIDKAPLPQTPVSPQPQKDITIGAVFGLVAGLALALAIDSLDRSIKTPVQAMTAFNAPVLASIPRQRAISDDPLVATKGAGSPAAEAYRALRTSVRFRDLGKRLRTILITSPAAGDGKTTVASNLAVAMSQDGARVILIDADLRRTRLNDVFGVDAGLGLSDVLLGRATLQEALVPWSGTLSILQTGPTVVYPSEALGSTAMVSVLKQAAEIADVVIIDAPPVLPVTDPVVLAAFVDGTILVCRWGRTSMHAAEATRLAMERTQGGSDVVGVVLNAEGGGRRSNYYRHYSTRPAQARRSREPKAPAPPSSPATNGAGELSRAETSARDLT